MNNIDPFTKRRSPDDEHTGADGPDPLNRKKSGILAGYAILGRVKDDLVEAVGGITPVTDVTTLEQLRERLLQATDLGALLDETSQDLINAGDTEGVPEQQPA